MEVPITYNFSFLYKYPHLSMNKMLTNLGICLYLTEVESLKSGITPF